MFVKQVISLLSILLIIIIILTVFNVNKCLADNAFHKDCPDIPFITRTEWGARIPNRSIPPQQLPVRHVFIHHTSSYTDQCLDLTACIRAVRSIQDNHMDSRQWPDIGYNLLIGGDGRVYFGRNYHTQGSQPLGMSNQSIQIAFIGQYSRREPSDRMVELSARLTKCLVTRNRLANDYQLHGHRDQSCTSSPGKRLYSLLGKNWPKNFVAGPLPGYQCPLTDFLFAGNRFMIKNGSIVDSSYLKSLKKGSYSIISGLAMHSIPTIIEHTNNNAAGGDGGNGGGSGSGGGGGSGGGSGGGDTIGYPGSPRYSGVGAPVGAATGAPGVGASVGAATGAPGVGAPVGAATGAPGVGAPVGSATGAPGVGASVGSATGAPGVGASVGSATGAPGVGAPVGAATGAPGVGAPVGSATGAPGVGAPVGAATGAPGVGAPVGAATGAPGVGH
ncbi:uncharacterized protein LOC128953277 [Oppia nitens]|uniref:uncharacterized protein LOC128953277 n=1 Tax=Oppia nitens TaxID=1686743 RepID=UPI0023DC6D6D|nr:uncharacterized protein LOC128953277 [Oppia nitens]